MTIDGAVLESRDIGMAEGFNLTAYLTRERRERPLPTSGRVILHVIASRANATPIGHAQSAPMTHSPENGLNAFDALNYTTLLYDALADARVKLSRLIY